MVLHMGVAHTLRGIVLPGAIRSIAGRETPKRSEAGSAHATQQQAEQCNRNNAMPTAAKTSAMTLGNCTNQN